MTIPIGTAFQWMIDARSSHRFPASGSVRQRRRDPRQGVRQLGGGTRGLALKPGDLITSGGVTKMLLPQAGDTARASFARLGTSSVTVVP